MLTVKRFTFNPLQENTYLLYNEERYCCIIDPGCYFKEEQDQLHRFILSLSLRPPVLLNTHCHLDHVFGNQFVFDTWGSVLHLHEQELPVLAYAPVSAQMYNLPFDNYREKTAYLQEGELIGIGKHRLKVLLTPGHAPGHVCFYCEAQQFVIGGDVLFRQGIGRTDLPGGDFDTLLRSIRSQLFALPDAVTVYPGHGEPTTIGYEKLYNPFLK